MVDNLHFYYCLENVIICHEGTDALDEVTDLDAYILQEGAAFQSYHDHDCFWVHFRYVEFHGEP